MNRLKISLVIQDMYRLGAQYVTSLVAKGLSQRGHDVHVVVSAYHEKIQRERPDLSPFVLPDSVQMIHLPQQKASRNILALASYMWNFRPDIVMPMSSNYEPACALAVRLMSHSQQPHLLPVVHTSGIGMNQSKSKIAYKYSWIAKWATNWANNQADHVMVVSQGVSDALVKAGTFPHTKISVVYNPVVDDCFIEKREEEPKHPWLINKTTPVIVAAGAHVPFKGYDVLIKSFSELREQIDSRLIIFGEGSETERLKALAKQLGTSESISFPGYTVNLPAELNKADIFVISSHCESFSVVLVEALACGVPIVSTNCPSGPPEILQNGRFGILVDPDNVTALAEGMLMVLNGKGITPPADSWQPYTLDNVIDYYEEAFFEVHWQMNKYLSSRSITSLDSFYPIFLWREALGVVLVIAFQRFGQPASLITGFGLLIWSMRNSKCAIQAMTLVSLMSYLNYNYFPVAFNSAAKWIVLLTASSSAIIHSHKAADTRQKQNIAWLLPLVFFIGVEGITSAIAGANPEMSLFKLFTFAIGALGAMYALGSADLSLPYITSWFYTVWAVIVMFSALLIKSGTGYIEAGLFMGILNHSQDFASFIVPILLYLMMRWLLGLKLSTWQKCLIILGLYLAYLSSSRTAVFAFLLALIGVACVYYARGASGAVIRARFIPRLATLVGVIIVLNILSSGNISEMASVFTHKYGAKIDVLATRGGKIEHAQRTFENHPVFGKGFGLAMDGEEFSVKRDPTFNIPLTAPVEAGVIYGAAPAQLGVLGTVFLLFFIYIYLKPLFSRGAAPFLGLAAVCFFINFGEYVFFSTGGVGMYHWLIYALAYYAAIRYPE